MSSLLSPLPDLSNALAVRISKLLQIFKSHNLNSSVVGTVSRASTSTDTSFHILYIYHLQGKRMTFSQFHIHLEFHFLACCNTSQSGPVTFFLYTQLSGPVSFASLFAEKKFLCKLQNILSQSVYKHFSL